MSTVAQWAAARAVKRGVAFLDQNYPDDWRARIDTEKLDISSISCCVGAQLEGGWGAFLAKHNLRLIGPWRYGFWRFLHKNYSHLTAAWKAELAA